MMISLARVGVGHPSLHDRDPVLVEEEPVDAAVDVHVGVLGRRRRLPVRPESARCRCRRSSRRAGRGAGGRSCGHEGAVVAGGEAERRVVERRAEAQVGRVGAGKRWGTTTRCAGRRRARPWRGRRPARSAARGTGRRPSGARRWPGSGTARTGVAARVAYPAGVIGGASRRRQSPACQLDPPAAVCPRTAQGPRWLPRCRGVVLPPPHRRPPRLRADPGRITRIHRKHRPVRRPRGHD